MQDSSETKIVIQNIHIFAVFSYHLNVRKRGKITIGKKELIDFTVVSVLLHSGAALRCLKQTVIAQLSMASEFSHVCIGQHSVSIVCTVLKWCMYELPICTIYNPLSPFLFVHPFILS